MAEELLGKLKEMFTLLSGTLSSEEEEQKRDELEQLFGEIAAKSGENANLKADAENLKKIVQQWDPIDKWFKEVDGLSSGIKKFLDIYYKTQDPKVEQPQTAGLDANSIALLKAAGIDVEKLIAAGVTIDVEKLKAVLLAQGAATTSQPQSKLDPKTEPKVEQKEEEKVEETKEENEAEEERKKKLESLLKGQPVEQTKTEQKKKLIAPKIEIPPINIRKEQKEEEKVDEDKVILNKQSSKIKIKIKTPTIIQTQENEMPEPQEETEEPINQPAMIKPVMGPKIAVVSNGGSQVNPVQRTNITPVANVQKPGIAPVANVQKPGIAPVANVQKPGIAPVANVQKSGIAPVANVQKPGIAPVANVQKPGIAPVANVQKPDMAKFESPNIKSVSPVKTVSKVDMKEKVDFKVQKMVDQEDSIYTDMSKENLLKELIYLQNRQYYFEKSKKVMAEKHKNGKISDADYRGELEKLKFETDRVTKNLTEVRTRLTAA